MDTQYSKSIVSIVAATLAVLGAAVTDGLITPVDAVSIAIAVVTAVAVYLVPNLDTGAPTYAKGTTPDSPRSWPSWPARRAG